MKILFACTCLEPGLDGVGDYTRRLAAELSARGHSCYLLALADAHVKEIDETPFAPANEKAGPLPSLRLPADRAWPERIALARKFCVGAAPDWISWQFVLYGFDPRGLAVGLGRRLRAISSGFKSQIMFHEIWIGEARKSPLKNKLIGKAQRAVIKDMVQKVGPLVVHTHTPLYQHLLGKFGSKVTRLPLFGNIPIASQPLGESLGEKLPAVAADRSAGWIFLIFGSIHPEWDADDFLRRAAASAQQAGKKCALVSIGRVGAAGERKLQEPAGRPENAAWTFLHLGRQPAKVISQWLLAADFGASSVPPEYLFKSGTAIAMIEHGLPVIATRPMYRYGNCPPELLSERMRNVVADFDLDTLKKTPAGSLLPEVAEQFLADLHLATPAPAAE